MTSLTKKKLTIVTLSILILSTITLDAIAGCSGSQGRKNAHGHSYKSYRHRQLKPKNTVSNTITAVEEPQTTEQAKEQVAATPVAEKKVLETSDRSASDAPTQTSYIVIQENKPGSGLDMNDEINPTINRGIFPTRTQAEQTAEMWRDVMPGWEVEVVEMPAK